MPLPEFKFTLRRYLHFDVPVGSQAASELACSPDAVIRHGFHPFISTSVVSQKIKKTAEGGVEYALKTREIMYAGHRDSQIYSRYAQLLQSPLEEKLISGGLEHSVTAFRRIVRPHHERLLPWRNVHFANEVFDFISAQGPCSALALDFSQFFDNLDHDILKIAWASLLDSDRLPDDHFAVFKAVTKYARVDREALRRELSRIVDNGSRVKNRLCTPAQFRQLRQGGLVHVNRTGRGIPQGSPLSAVLSNIYMLEFDGAISQFVKLHGGLYRRYCDDILVVMPSFELREQAETLIMGWCQRLKLTVNPGKTERFEFIESATLLTTMKPLQYLGFTFDGRNRRIRPASVARFFKKMRTGVRRAKAIRFRADRQAGRPFTSGLRRKQLLLRYSYHGRHNFLSYAFDAARIMSDRGIKKQVKKHWTVLQQLIAGG